MRLADPIQVHDTVHAVRRNLVPFAERPWSALCRSAVEEDRCRLLLARRGCIFHEQRGSYASDPLVVGQGMSPEEARALDA